eukprot:CAMPEP_0113592492 /NCGR_PEP_ID=MMETSP0015_2-20120614/37875_1 /TAXON_ID=2838 /ORGANISM="Odontella" /LENGTH=59 /DNA_ID=CAMNT_0000499031 /DNA_START=74 /DNA_END=249 /DNA_ORIENTATION=+ /assembly_acc=CAM_ASM_000160
MKGATVIVAAATLASASAFVPAGDARPSSALFEKKPLAQRIFDMDLFAPKSDQNDYGAR